MDPFRPVKLLLRSRGLIIDNPRTVEKNESLRGYLTGITLSIRSSTSRAPQSCLPVRVWSTKLTLGDRMEVIRIQWVWNCLCRTISHLHSDLLLSQNLWWRHRIRGPIPVW